MKILPAKHLLFVLGVFLSITTKAQYCSSGPLYTADSEIENVILYGDCQSISNLNTCPGIVGLANYRTTDSADVSKGSSYTLTVTFGTCGDVYSGAGQVWIDWNQDGTFQSTESIGTWSGNPTATVNFNFTVPSNAQQGKTVMRVKQQEGGSLPLSPCGNFDWGSVEDYRVTVKANAPNCPVPTTLSASNISATSATISWASTGNSFNYEFGVAGFARGTGTTGTSNTTQATITGLSGTTTYEFYVQNACSGGGNMSCWAGPYSFTTPCDAINMFPYLENFDGGNWYPGVGAYNYADTIEDCWERNPGPGLYFWGVRSGGTPSTGTGPSSDFSTTGKYLYTEATNGSPGDSAILYTPQFLLDSLAAPYLSFKYHMFGLTMGTMTVQVDSGAGWTTVWTQTGQQQTSSGSPWIDALVDVSTWRSTHTQFRFIGVCGQSSSDMAIDELSITESPLCPVPGFPSVSNISDVSVDLDWISSGTNFIIEYGTVGFTPGVGAGTIVNVTGNSTTLSGLLSSTEYDVYIINDCSGAGNGTSATVGPVTFTTYCPPTITYVENFDLFNSGQIPDCFFSMNGAFGFANISTAQSNSAPASVQIYNSSNTSSYTTLISPMHSNLDSDTMQIRFEAMVSNSGMSFYVGTLRDPQSDSSMVIIDTITPTTANTWDPYIVELSNVTVGHDHIAFIHPGNPGFSYVYIDDYNYEPIPDCIAPTALNLISSTTNSASFYWTQGGSTTSQLEWGVKPHTLGSGTRMNVTNDTATISGLTPNTTYQIWVRDTCVSGSYSPWFGPVEFSTPCTVKSMPFVEDFETWPVTCWSQSGTFNWVSYTDGSSNTWAEASFYDYSTGTAVFQSPSITISQNAWLKFDWSHLYDPVYPNDELLVLARVAGSTSWDTLADMIGNGNFNTPGGQNGDVSATPSNAIIYLPAGYVGNDVEFALFAITDYGPDLFVDNFEVSALPNCVAPNTFVTDSVSSTTASVSWVSPSNPTQYFVEWGYQGYTQGSGFLGRDTVTNPTIYLQSLPSDTCFDIWVQSDCGSGVTSTWSSHGFCTTVSCPAPSNINLVNVSTSQATIGWTSGGSTNWNVVVGPMGIQPSGANIQFGVTNNPLTMGSLQPGTKYDFFVRDSCGPGDVSPWVGPFTFTTPCAPYSMNYSETFAGSWVAGGGLYCWDLTGGSQTWVEDAGSGSAMADFWNFPTGDDMIMTSPIITISQDARIRFKWSHSYNTLYPNDKLMVLVRDTSSTSTWDTLWTRSGSTFNSNDGAGNTNPGTFVEDTLVLNTSYTGSAIQIKFYGHSGYGPRAYVDDVIVEPVPAPVACKVPDQLAVTATTDTSATLSWNAGIGSSWEIRYSTSPYNPNGATVVQASTNPFVLNGLAPNTSYSFVVREICAVGDTSLPSFSFAFRTNCSAVYGLPYNDAMGGWITNNNLSCWDFTGGTRNWSKYGTDVAVAKFWNWNSGQNAKMTSPVINLTSKAALRFKWSHDYQANFPGDSLAILVKDTSAGSSWMVVWSAGGSSLESNDGATNNTPGTFREDTVYLDPAIYGQYITVQFHAISGNGPNLFIDEVNLEQSTFCGAPSNIGFSKIGCDSVVVSWTPNSGSVYSWVEFGNAGFTPGTGTVLANPSNPAVITGLTPGSAFDVYVQDSCSTGRSTRIKKTVVTGTAPLPIIKYNVSQTSTSFNQATLTLDASQSINGTVFKWNFLGGGSANGAIVARNFTTNGLKMITLTVSNGCGSVDTTFIFEVKHIGIEESDFSRNFKVYPNPTQGVFNISFDVDQPLDATMQIVDNLGRKVLSRDLGTIRESVDIPVDLTNLAQGVYIIRIESDKGILNSRITIQH